MMCEYQRPTRRRFLKSLALVFGTTGTAGCAPEGVGSVKLKNSGGKFKTLTGKGAGKSRRQIPGPKDMNPADGGR